MTEAREVEKEKEPENPSVQKEPENPILKADRDEELALVERFRTKYTATYNVEGAGVEYDPGSPYYAFH